MNVRVDDVLTASRFKVVKGRLDDGTWQYMLQESGVDKTYADGAGNDWFDEGVLFLA